MEEDRISILPEDVLRRIVSFLPTESAVATSILARPWRNLYTSNPNLDFDDNKSIPETLFVEFVTKSGREALFEQFVSKLLRSNTSQSIHSLRFSFRARHSESTINNWISAALSRNIRNLHISKYFGGQYTFDVSQFCCSNLKTLQVLEFRGVDFPEIPESVVLPSLRVLFLNAIVIEDNSSDTGAMIASYFRSCPLLEEFSMHSCSLYGQVQICHAQLKKVSIYFCLGMYDLVLNSPNLQHLELYADYNQNYTVKNPESLVTAGFRFRSIADGHSPSFANVDNFVGEMHNVCFLHLSTLYLLYSSNHPLAAFQNVTFLEPDTLDPEGRLFFEHLLDTIPRLEVLVFLEGISDYDEKYELRFPTVKPVCLSSTFRELRFTTFCGRKCEMEIIKYFLANADVLEEVMLGSGVYLLSPFVFARMYWSACWEDFEMDPVCVSRTSEALAGVPKASKTCHIVISWIKGGKLCRRNINEFPDCPDF